MGAANKFNSFVEAQAEKTHNLGSDTLKVMLTNTAPLAANTVKADITEISAGNGYTAGGTAAVQSSSAQAGGTYTLASAQVTFTASGGSIGPFRYFVLYNDTSASKELILWWDYTTALTLADGDSLTFKFNSANPGTVLTVA